MPQQPPLTFSRPAPPRIWLLLSDKLGDNAQVRTVAAALGLRCDEKNLHFKRRYAKMRPAFKASIDHLDSDHSAALAAPWPDLIITSGRRPAAVALWIKQQSAGHSRIVIVGRPHRQLGAFDLVLAPPQFALPERPNILPLAWPLFAVDRAEIAAEARLWASRFAELPRPLTAILLGGPQPPFRFTKAVALDIIAKAARQSDHGTLVILTSRRTPAAITRAIARALPQRALLFPWSRNPETNPYRAVLGLADRFVVTGESISMIGEVLSLGKPLAIAGAPQHRQPHILLEQAMARRFRAARAGEKGFWSWLKGYVHGNGMLPFARDFTRFHRDLVARGAAVMLGEPFPQAGMPACNDLSLAVARILSLIGGEPSSVEPPRR